MNAFDVLAPAYDADFTAAPVARHLRQLVHTRLAQTIQTGDCLLELGCGTGEDARATAGMGAVVTATDASPAMLALTADKTQGLSVTTAFLDLNQLPLSGFQSVYAGVYANFGALNCVEDRPALARWLAARVAVGGWVALAVMPPWCLWEMGWHALHGEWHIATRRWRRATFQPEGSTPLNVFCPTPRQLADDFHPWFRRETCRPLGVLLPHSAAYPVVTSRPHLLRTLTRLDTMVQNWSILAPFADHYWMVLRRNP